MLLFAAIFYAMQARCGVWRIGGDGEDDNAAAVDTSSIFKSFIRERFTRSIHLAYIFAHSWCGHAQLGGNN